MKVSDVMSKQVDYVTPETKVRDICRLIFGRGINGVPVCKKRKIIGFITEKDVLDKFYPSMQDYVTDPVHARDFEEMEDQVSTIFSLTAEDIMSKDPITVTTNTPLLRANSLMTIHKVGRLPVVDEKKNLVGILSKGDVFRVAVGDKLELVENETYNDWLSKRYYQTVDTKNRMSLEIPDLIKVFRKNNVQKVLDIGCGTGEHCLELAKHGFSAVGIERSKLMVQDANKKRNSLPAEIQKRVDFIAGEYEDLIKHFQKEEFQAAIIMGNSISHNPYNYQDVIGKTAQMLSKRSIIIVQVRNFEKIFKTQKRLDDFITVESAYEISPYQEHIFLEFYDPSRDGGKTILKTFAIFDFDGKRWKFYGLRNALFAYVTKENLAKTLKRNGYKNITFYGSFYDGRKWDYLFRKTFKPAEHDWLNIIAKR